MLSALCWNECKDDDTLDQMVFKDELEEGGNPEWIYGGAVGGTFWGSELFSIFRHEGLILVEILVCHFLQAIFSQGPLLSCTSLPLPGTNFIRSSFFLADWKARFPVLSKVKDKDLTPNLIRKTVEDVIKNLNARMQAWLQIHDPETIHFMEF